MKEGKNEGEEIHRQRERERHNVEKSHKKKVFEAAIMLWVDDFVKV